MVGSPRAVGGGSTECQDIVFLAPQLWNEWVAFPTSRIGVVLGELRGRSS